MYPPGEVGVEQAEDSDDSTEDDCCDDVGEGGSGAWVWGESGVAGDVADLGMGWEGWFQRRISGRGLLGHLSEGWRRVACAW